MTIHQPSAKLLAVQEAGAIMAEDFFNQPKAYDAVISNGSQNLPPMSGVVLGGIEGIKQRLTSSLESQRIIALRDALKYREAGLDLVIQALKDESWQVRGAAYLLLRQRSEPSVKQALQEYIATVMIAWWRLDEIEGHTAVDSVGTNHGTIYGSTHTPLAPGILPGLGGALYFDGMNDYVEVPDAPALNFGTGDLSMWVWIKTSKTSGIDVIVDKRVETSGPVQGYVASNYSGNLLFQLADGLGSGFANYDSKFFIADGVWHQVAITVDRDLIDGGRWYVDGVEVGKRFNPTGRQGCLSNPKPLRIGKRSDHPGWPGFFKGSIGDLRLFNRALSATEIQAIYKGYGMFTLVNVSKF